MNKNYHASEGITPLENKTIKDTPRNYEFEKMTEEEMTEQNSINILNEFLAYKEAFNIIINS